MGCLNGYIGIKVCSQPDSESGIYVNQLPGISIKAMDMIADSDQVSFQGVWTDIENRGIDRLKSKVLSFLKTNYKLKKVLDFHSMPQITTVAVASTGIWRGFTLQTVLEHSELLCLYIQEFSLYSTGTASSVPFKIVDIHSKEVLYTTTKDLVSGWNKVYLNKSFISTGVFICFLDTGVGMKSLQLFDAHVHNSCECYFDHPGCRAFVHGATCADLTALDLDLGTDSFGLTATVGLHCNFEAYICANKEMFTQALLYSIGNEFAIERQFTERVNPYTSLDKKNAEKLQELCNGIFEQEVELACGSINMEKDCCVECKEFGNDVWTTG